MPSAHGEPQLAVRLPADLKRDAQAELAERGMQTRAFVVACLTALVADPDRFLAALKPHWPDKKPYLGGRAAAKRDGS